MLVLATAAHGLLREGRPVGPGLGLNGTGRGRVLTSEPDSYFRRRDEVTGAAQAQRALTEVMGAQDYGRLPGRRRAAGAPGSVRPAPC
jgi:hypothetical protein